jgi:D-3-phosphoglycerate dehydrogenase
MKVLLADTLPAETQDKLLELGFEVEFQPELGPDDLPAAMGDAHVLVVRSTRVTRACIQAAASLQIIIRAGAGTNTIDCEAASAHGIFVANCPGKNAVAVAELAMGLILSLDRRIPDNVSALRDGQWRKSQFAKSRGLFGRTLGIIGLGRIGLEVLHRAKAFGMECVAWSRSLSDEQAAELGVERCSSVMDLCRRADIVTVHVALSEETRHLLGASEIDAMRPGALLVNLSRGGVVDDIAMKSAVDRGGIRAASDVFEQEPKGGEAGFDNPLSESANFYGTHHIGASTEQAQIAIAEEVARILAHWLDTGTVLNCVNRSQHTPAAGQLLVRHLDRVGVLATVLDVLKGADINVKEMQNTMFEGAVAACAKITVEQAPNSALIVQLQACSEHVLGVEFVPNS